jgi:hypothetical protein
MTVHRTESGQGGFPILFASSFASFAPSARGIFTVALIGLVGSPASAGFLETVSFSTLW